MLFGLIRPDSGTIRVFGQTWDDGRGRRPGRGRRLHREPEVLPLPDRPAEPRGPRPARRRRPARPLDGGARRRRPRPTGPTDKVGGYSYGMRQRLGVAASLLREPRLLVLDEPANGLDPAGIRDMRALVKRLAGSGLTVLLSSHDMDEVEEICDNVTIMRRGPVAFHGTIADAARDGAGARPPARHHRRRRAPLALAADHPARRGRPGPGGGPGRRPARSTTCRRTSPRSCAPTSTCSPSPRPRRRWRRCSSCSPTTPTDGPAPDEPPRGAVR